jgi:hypothetical protein
MTRAHPYVLDGARLIVPLYSDGFSFSLMAITDDWGATRCRFHRHVRPSFFAPPASVKPDAEKRLPRKSIKHAHFNEAWIRSQGESGYGAEGTAVKK